MLLLRLASASKTAEAPALISPLSSTATSTPAAATTTTTTTPIVDVKPTAIKLESQPSPKPSGRQNQRTAKAGSEASVIQTSDSSNKLAGVREGGHSKTISTSGGDGAASARLLDLGKRLIEAARAGQLDQVRHLVEEAGAPFTSDWLGTTALHAAAQWGHSQVAEVLVRGGVNRDARTKLERTALHLAAQSGSLEIVDLLLNSGSDVNCCDMLRMTPLHWAAERGHVHVARRLVLAGANVFASNKFLLTPIDIARESGCCEMLELFRQNWTFDMSIMGNCQSQHLDTLAKNPAQILTMAGAGMRKSEVKLEHQHADVHNSSASLLEPDVACLNLLGFEWNKCDFDLDSFLTSESGTSVGDEFDDKPPKVEYLMKVVEKLQEENQQLRQKVEQLSTSEP